jgi:hypothetical protein
MIDERVGEIRETPVTSLTNPTRSIFEMFSPSKSLMLSGERNQERIRRDSKLSLHFSGTREIRDEEKVFTLRRKQR